MSETASIKIKDKVQKIGFWVVLFVLFGFSIGFYSSKIYFKSCISNVIKTKRLIHENKIYDLTENIILTTEANSKYTNTKVITAQQIQNSVEALKK